MNDEKTDMVPSHKIIADRLEFVLSNPLLDFGRWYFIYKTGINQHDLMVYECVPDIPFMKLLAIPWKRRSEGER